MKRLIVSADDFGLTRGVNRGIVKGIRDGIVTSTSLIGNSICADDALDLSIKNSLDCIGVHLNLTFGEPISLLGKVPTLVDSEGKFYHKTRTREMLVKANPEEIELEFRAQIQKVFDAGLTPTHLNGNYDVHSHPETREIVFRLAHEFKLPVRRNTPEMAELLKKNGIVTSDYYVGNYFGDYVISNDKCLEILGGLKDGLTELGSHPGYCDEDLPKATSYTFSRQRELEIFTDHDIKQYIKTHNIILTKEYKTN